MPDDDWDDIADWWIATLGSDPGDSEETLAIVLALIEPAADRTLDLGCGDGRILPLLGGRTIGVDLAHSLLVRARDLAPVVRSRLPDLSWVRPGTIDQAVAVGLVDLIADERQFFEQVAGAVRRDGVLVVVMNHPVATAPDSEPLVDPSGRVLWRWGRYLQRGSLPHPAGDRTVELQHRPLGVLLTSAASAGWRLERLVEVGATGSTVDTSSGMRDHEHLPVLLGARWRRN